MILIFFVSYILLCFLVAQLITVRFLSPPADTGNLSKLLARVVIFFATFFSGFFILGYVNLLTNLPVVSPLYATVVVILVFAGLKLWFGDQMLWLLRKTAPSPISVPLKDASGVARALAVITLVTFVSIGLMLIVGFPRGYESRAYHLPIALHMAQTQSLQIWDTSVMHTFPANGSIYFGFLLGFISEHLVAAAGLVFLVVLFAGAYGVGRATGADGNAALLASLGLVTIPIIAFPAFGAGSDVAGAAFLSIAVYFALEKSERSSLRYVLSGLAAGLAFGFKSLHLVSIVFLFTLILLQVWSKARRNASIRKMWALRSPAVLFLISTVAMSGFWLARNYMQLGNPLYPVHVSVFDSFGWAKAPDFDLEQRAQTQFQWVRSSIEWLVYPWVEWHSIGENFKGSSGLGPFFAAAVPVACLASLIGVVKKDSNGGPPIAWLLGGGFFVLLVWWILGDRQPRYFIGALVFLVPLVAWTITQTEGWSRKVFESVIALCILSMLFIIFSTQLVEFGARFVYAKQFTRDAFYVYPGMVDRLPPGSTIINLGRRTRHYALYGKAHRNRVVSYPWSIRALPVKPSRPEGPAPAGHLPFLTLRDLGATHLFTEGRSSFSLDDCVQLQEIDRLDKHPVIGTAIPEPPVLYEIKYCELKGENSQ